MASCDASGSVEITAAPVAVYGLVTDLDALSGVRFTFDVDFGPVPIAHWTYELEPTDGGCRVTESARDRRPPLFPLFSGLATGRQDRGAANRANITATLLRLKARAEAA